MNRRTFVKRLVQMLGAVVALPVAVKEIVKPSNIMSLPGGVIRRKSWESLWPTIPSWTRREDQCLIDMIWNASSDEVREDGSSQKT